MFGSQGLEVWRCEAQHSSHTKSHFPTQFSTQRGTPACNDFLQLMRPWTSDPYTLDPFFGLFCFLKSLTQRAIWCRSGPCQHAMLDAAPLSEARACHVSIICTSTTGWFRCCMLQRFSQ